MKRWMLLGVLCAALLLGAAASSRADEADGADTSPACEDYRAAMREFVQDIGEYAREQREGFVVVPQNGLELLTLDGEPDGPLAEAYVAAIDGVGREDLFYGYKRDDKASPKREVEFMLAQVDRAKAAGLAVLVTDYCTTRANVDDSYARNAEHGFVSIAQTRDLNVIPSHPTEPPGAHDGDIATLADARNMLYLIDPDAFDSRDAFIDAVAKTRHDVLVVDAYAQSDWLRAEDIERLHRKRDGGRRLVLAYLSIGEAESYREYWQRAWTDAPPRWLGEENPDWTGNFKVRYWDPEWQAVILGDESAYLDRILTAGFDGAYLDIIDAFEHFESEDE